MRLQELMKGTKKVQVLEESLAFSSMMSSRIDDKEEDSQPSIVVIKRAQKPMRNSSLMVQEENKQREEGLQRENQMRLKEQMSRNDKKRIEDLRRKEKRIEK